MIPIHRKRLDDFGFQKWNGSERLARDQIHPRPISPSMHCMLLAQA